MEEDEEVKVQQVVVDMTHMDTDAESEPGDKLNEENKQEEADDEDEVEMKNPAAQATAAPPFQMAKGNRPWCSNTSTMTAGVTCTTTKAGNASGAI